MTGIYRKHGMRLGNFADVAAAIFEVNGGDPDPLTVEDIILFALKAEKFLVECRIPLHLMPGAEAVISTRAENTGNEIVLRRAANDWRLVGLSNLIDESEKEASFNVFLTDRQLAITGASQTYEQAA
ncbi:hypothetical protein [Mesorhizobium sp. A623]